MRKDLALNEHGDLLIQHGDFVIAESDAQHVNDIFSAFNGEFKEFPRIGFAATSRLKSIPNIVSFKRDLKEELLFDGYKSASIDLNEGFDKLKINI